MLLLLLLLLLLFLNTGLSRDFVLNQIYFHIYLEVWKQSKKTSKINLLELFVKESRYLPKCRERADLCDPGGGEPSREQS